MILLDTNHLSEFKYRHHPRSMRLRGRMDAHPDQRFATTIIAYEEQHRGWLSVIARHSDPRKQVGAYRELSALARFLRHWEIVDFDDESAEQFTWLKKARPRVSTMDLKMAAIALRHDALLLTANRKDFTQIPGLRFENWLEE